MCVESSNRKGTVRLLAYAAAPAPISRSDAATARRESARSGSGAGEAGRGEDPGPVVLSTPEGLTARG